MESWSPNVSTLNFQSLAWSWSRLVPRVLGTSLVYLPRLHSTPPLGGPRRNIALTFGVEKLKWLSIPYCYTKVAGQTYSPAAEMTGSVCLKL